MKTLFSIFSHIEHVRRKHPLVSTMPKFRKQTKRSSRNRPNARLRVRFRKKDSFLLETRRVCVRSRIDLAGLEKRFPRVTVCKPAGKLNGAAETIYRETRAVRNPVSAVGRRVHERSETLAIPEPAAGRHNCQR